MRLIILVLLQIYICICAFAQDTTETHYAVLRIINARENTYKIVYDNGTNENLVDSLRLSKYLDQDPIPEKYLDMAIFDCLKYLSRKGYELVTFSMKNYEREYILKRTKRHGS